MKAAIVRIGNSQGIRIPKSVIEECGFSREVMLTVRRRTLLVEAAHRPRAGWDAAFAKIVRHGDDARLLEGARASWDTAEWTW